MSRSLSRIRNLVSEIEQIQRQGQQGGLSALERTVNLKPIPEAVKVAASPVRREASREEAVDPFLELASVVHLDSKRSEPKTDSVGKIHIQLSGQVVISLQIENSDELVELKQVGESIEIRFADGKAVHLPLKAVV